MKSRLLSLLPSAIATSILIVMLANMQAEATGSRGTDPAAAASASRAIEPACGRPAPAGTDRCL
jgi:hypothetical protein